uniref:Uncharacterized protein n=1 Tax=Romanomermis culicivorax TaxID=13658 RepID=A0A915HZY4_ROMCU
MHLESLGCVGERIHKNIPCKCQKYCLRSPLEIIIQFLLNINMSELENFQFHAMWLAAVDENFLATCDIKAHLHFAHGHDGYDQSD